ncbi:hypothetical protein B0H16DRAFT_1811072 [Mycena metata]|uniref:Uncharacterized protein n=1 Tax=Mycena metata TaxID=1033252 RepID=A0AAD7JBH6_9AGAR|nr:hypothetical protein B0H16DRAFT_1811072 [Mycena metata]
MEEGEHRIAKTTPGLPRLPTPSIFNIAEMPERERLDLLEYQYYLGAAVKRVPCRTIHKLYVAAHIPTHVGEIHLGVPTHEVWAAIDAHTRQCCVVEHQGGTNDKNSNSEICRRRCSRRLVGIANSGLTKHWLGIVEADRGYPPENAETPARWVPPPADPLLHFLEKLRNLSKTRLRGSKKKGFSVTTQMRLGDLGKPIRSYVRLNLILSSSAYTDPYRATSGLTESA